jgi:hypothetical protein
MVLLSRVEVDWILRTAPGGEIRGLCGDVFAQGSFNFGVIVREFHVRVDSLHGLLKWQHISSSKPADDTKPLALLRAEFRHLV